jgi:S1-C subfamily serine protease
MKYPVLVGLLMVVGLWLQPEAQARTQDVREAIVKIYTVHNVPDYYNPWNMRGTQGSTGSGCIIAGNRILSNAHVVRDQTFVQVRRYGESRRYQARVLYVSHPADLAILTVDDESFFEDVEPLEFGPLPDTQEEVHVYGFPMGGDTLSITEGVISRIEHQVYAHSSANLLAAQIDAAVNPGNSGGPALVNDLIVGVAMQGITQADNIGYIVPAPVIERFMTDIASGERDGIPGMGVMVQPMENPDMRRHYGMDKEQTGVLVTRVAYGSPAEGQIEADDVLLAINGQPIADDGTVEFRPKERTSFAYYVQQNQIGDSIEIELLRDGELRTEVIALTTPIERDRLVPLEQYDILPTYYIYGGVVFVPLTKNLLHMWGNNWFNSAPKELVVYLGNNMVTEDQDEVVVALKVLAADVNQGYHGQNHWVIEEVDGEPVRNLRHLIERVEAGAGNDFVEFKSQGGQKMILDRAKVEAEQAMIQQIYRIPNDRSDDLL